MVQNLPPGDHLMRTLGIRLVEATPDHAVAQLDFRPELQQLTGVFHTGAILSLADSTATWGAMQVVGNGAEVPPEQFPLAVQLSVSLLRNVGEGALTAEARAIHRGRTMIVMETEVRDERERRLAVVTTTHLVLGR